MYISNYRIKEKSFLRKQRIGNFFDLVKIWEFKKGFLSLINWNRQFVILIESERDMIIQIQTKKLMGKMQKILERYCKIYGKNKDDCGIIVCTMT
jgi:hypothetical protein